MKLIVYYYWLTPLFWLLDELGGANVRTAALQGHPWWKALYYLFCMGILVVSHYHRDWTDRLGLAETSINIALLVTGVYVPYFRSIGRLAQGELLLANPITGASVGNFLLSAVVLTVSYHYYRERRRAMRSLGHE